MTPLEMIAEWRKGCSVAASILYPENCQSCTRALIDALEKALRNEHPACEVWNIGEPFIGKNYEAGMWSRRNWEAMIEDQASAGSATAAYPFKQQRDDLLRVLEQLIESTFGGDMTEMPTYDALTNAKEVIGKVRGALQ